MIMVITIIKFKKDNMNNDRNTNKNEIIIITGTIITIIEITTLISVSEYLSLSNNEMMIIIVAIIIIMRVTTLITVNEFLVLSN